MTTETKTCQNCKQSFTIEPDDFDFYEKIKVPPPRWCPRCRQMRRYAWRNERVLYRRDCDLCGKSIVTIYSENKPYKIYCPSCWWSDKWSGADYARDFDFSRPFFEQFGELQLQAPRIALLTKNSVNSDYTNHSSDNRNCYLCFGSFESENLMYSANMWGGQKKDSSDCYRVYGPGELLYELIDSERCYRCQFGIRLRDCVDCFYSYDCSGCSNCFLSFNLRSKQYYILNQPYSKEEYSKKIQEYRLGSFAERQKLYDQFVLLVKQKALHRFAVIEKSTDVSGNMITNSRNAHHVFDGDNLEDIKYATLCTGMKSSMDFYHVGLNCELIYEGHGMIHDYDVLFTHLSYDNSHLQYCDSCHNSENLFGCVSVKQGKYCILNKPYSEAEYHSLKARIIEHMRKTGEYGEFFPAELSPFGYNETQGQIYMPLSKEEVQKLGWKWKEKVPGTFGKETIKPEQIPDNVRDVADSIVNEILVCTKCKKNFNVIKPELDLYRRENIPIPRLCSDCRYKRRIGLRPPRELWHRICACKGLSAASNARQVTYRNTVAHFHGGEPCPNEFETPYAPERPEIIYCEPCYQVEVA